ncbi:RNA polymerase subunit sigma-28 [Clostridium sp. P21]|uniref:RNA polymerase sigma factor SigI n=1 Tax=Clostridium muellerianum TaxID=2716538 RepID=A0A7Y0HPG6_9CLOT|nr:sigma factor [Clostridium muellerianum]NMM62673.1 RNA polymerase subunit sigma-28 [Clostridium muellerianum]
MSLQENLIKNRDTFIEENKKFIYNVTFSICKKRLQWENDDELSVALIAFNNACNSYVETRGNFFSYAKVIIKNALIDYFRKNSNKYLLSFGEENDELENAFFKNSLSEYDIKQENMKRCEEIKVLSEELKKYNISFKDLVKNSPCHKDTKDKLLNVSFSCSKDYSILDYIHKHRRLPVKQICIITGCSRKLIDQWRKYILSLIVIISNESYYYITSYLNIKVGEDNEK